MEIIYNESICSDFLGEISSNHDFSKLNFNFTVYKKVFLEKLPNITNLCFIFDDRDCGILADLFKLNFGSSDVNSNYDISNNYNKPEFFQLFDHYRAILTDETLDDMTLHCSNYDWQLIPSSFSFVLCFYLSAEKTGTKFLKISNNVFYFLDTNFTKRSISKSFIAITKCLAAYRVVNNYAFLTYSQIKSLDYGSIVHGIVLECYEITFNCFLVNILHRESLKEFFGHHVYSTELLTFNAPQNSIFATRCLPSGCEKRNGDESNFSQMNRQQKEVCSDELLMKSSTIEVKNLYGISKGLRNVIYDTSKLISLLNGIDHSTKTLIEFVFEIFQSLFDKFKADEIVLCFNGGKDCTVLLYLLFSYFNISNHLRSEIQNSFALPVKLLLIWNKDTYEEIDSFVAKIIYLLNCSLIEINGANGMKHALTTFKHHHPHIKACLMGSRRTDGANTKMEVFQETDNDWPKLTRVNPLLDWTYSDIWKYLKYFDAPYCKLYDEGYTSLGLKSKTIKNEELYDPETNTYKPAYELKSATSERIYRT